MKSNAFNPAKKRTILIYAFLIITCLYFSKLALRSRKDENAFLEIDQWKKEPKNIEQKEEFWINLAGCLQASKPSNRPPPQGPPDAKWNGIPGAPTYNIDMSPEDIKTMKVAHANYTSCVQSISLSNVYMPDTRGIVTTAGGKYIPIFLVSLLLLRKTGSNLPVEVFLADESEYEEYFCDKLLPSLNARCRVISRELGAVQTFSIKSYQFKILSILFSSFEDVLFLDADNLALNDPTFYFDSQPYQGYGMVLWPDFWVPTVSPTFYEIQGKPELSLEENSKTCETGQILISKRIQDQSLLLATYYNIYGPDYYYSLLSQGSPGEGDKETFAAAAEYLESPYYLVNRNVEPLGFFDSDDGDSFRGQAMLQFEPHADFEGLSKEQIKPAFIHANFPKFDPFTILDKGITSYKNSDRHRIWHDVHEKNYDIAWGTDPEPPIWEEMVHIACKLGDRFRYISKDNNIALCSKLKYHYMSLFGFKRSVWWM